MQRRKFIEMGGLLAATAAQMNTFAGSPRPPKSNDHQDKVDFMFDGVELSPKEYTDLLTRLVDEGKVKPDNYSRGGTVEELENKFATLLGKESAVFMPTGTLANHIAVRKLAGNNRRVIVQEQSHLYNDSGDCTETLSGLNLITAGARSVDFSLEEVVAIVNQTKSGRVETRIGAISMETPVRRQLDRIFKYDRIKPITDYARTNGIRTHLDGARLFVQSVHTDIDPARYGELFDTVYTSMYKCFNAPSGAILAGPRQFTESLFHERRMFGSGLPAAWPFAAIALHYAEGFMSEYRKAWSNAQKLFSLLRKDDRFTVSEFESGTHIVRLDLKASNLKAFQESMTKRNIYLYEPAGSGFFLKINPTINRIQPEALAGLFLESLKGLK